MLNVAPVAVDDDNATTVNTPTTGNVINNDSDPNPADILRIANPVTGEAITDSVTITTAQNGTVVLQSNGDYEYTPPTGFTGTDTFAYTVTDQQGNTDTAAVTIDVEGVNGPIVDLVTRKLLLSGDTTPDVGDNVIFLVHVQNLSLIHI